ncbi:MAG: TetR/AcrR family transcriptional regulator [Acidimicrobiales bacterium]
MPTLRWGDEVPADVNAARERLLDAAESCIDRFGLAKTTVEDIANEAKVSRATIYRYFDNRDELVLAVVLRSLERSQGGNLDEYFTGAATPEQFGDALVDAMVHLLDRLRHDPKLGVLLNRDSGGVSATITGASQALFTIVIGDWHPRMTAAQRSGLLRADLDVDELSEWVLRSVLSLLTVEGPRHHTADDERRLLATFLAPALVPERGAPALSGPSAPLDRAR